MTNQELILRAEQELATLAPADLLPGGMENLEPGDTGMPPRLRISQRNRPIDTGNGEAPAGSIVNTLTGEIFESGVEIVPMVFFPTTRVMWPPTFSADNDPMCLSDDGERPYVGVGRKVTDPQPGPCSECAYAQFSDNGTPPACKRQRNFLVLLVDSMEPAILTLSSTALKAARTLTTLARTQGLRKSVMFTAQEMDNDKGRWHVPAFTAGNKLDAQTILTVIEQRNELANLAITADVEDVEQVTIDPKPDFEESDELPF